MELWLWIIIVIVVIIAIWFIVAYNLFIRLKNRIENSWSQIDVQLRRRYDLIPNLVKTVKAYAKHEKQTFEMVTKARSAMLKAETPREKAKADNMLTGALKTIFAVAEAYPQLRANENFKMLQEELSGTESKIAYSRQFYNDTVLRFNNSIKIFPNNVIAGMFGFKEQEYFDIEEKAARKPVKVDL